MRATSSTVPPACADLERRRGSPMPDEAPVIRIVCPLTASCSDWARMPPAPGIRLPNARSVRTLPTAMSVMSGAQWSISTWAAMFCSPA